ncbi:hypothetical protein WMF28_30085 [Sorangium sp. So ce590]|uniref:hypothetical protein n=1 Tax=Sorangium sp. So ce590 TaxID=3133317 RepID=UPI003F635B05
MVQDDAKDAVPPELPAEVAVAVLDELRAVSALLDEAARTASAMADRTLAGARCPCGGSRPPEVRSA